jgi:hypothetical protein
MSASNVIKVARLLARRNGIAYGAMYMRSAGMPFVFARYFLLRAK